MTAQRDEDLRVERRVAELLRGERTPAPIGGLHRLVEPGTELPLADRREAVAAERLLAAVQEPPITVERLFRDTDGFATISGSRSPDSNGLATIVGRLFPRL